MDNRNVLMYGRGGTLARVRSISRVVARVPHPPRASRAERALPAFSRASAPDARRSRPPHRLPPSPLHRRHAAARAHSHSWRMPRVARVSHVRPRQICRGRARHLRRTAPRPDRTTTRARPSTTHLIDATLNWRALRPSGKRPSARGGHCAVAVAPTRPRLREGPRRRAPRRYRHPRTQIEIRHSRGRGGKHLGARGNSSAHGHLRQPRVRACAVFIPPRPHPDGRARTEGRLGLRRFRSANPRARVRPPPPPPPRTRRA